MQNKTYPYVVASICFTARNVVLLEVAPRAGGPVFDFKPGQFAMLRLLKEDGTLWRQEAYSMSSSPLRTDTLEFAFKVAGEFTQALARLKPGDAVEVAGPYGIFTLRDDMQNVVFVGGGVGITPLLSMLRYATTARPNITMTLIYCNHAHADVPFLTELKELAARNPRLTLKLYVSTEPQPPDTEQARLTEELLTAQTAPFDGKYFLLCGPKGFMETAKAFYIAQGVSPDHVRMEKF